MVNKICAFMKRYEMVKPGDSVICAVSGGADSMALLWAMYLLKDKLQITLSAAHFNHHLRGDESNRDEAFVTAFCEGYDIPLYKGEGQILPGEKGLEDAAREARYAFLDTLPGKIATAHTADDNAETLLMHLIRGTGLKGLGGISPILGKRIRPMLAVTREEVLAFLDSYHLSYVEDSSNHEDAFLRNRLRHHVMPLLKQENPRLSENLTEMALQLREDEALLAARKVESSLSVSAMKEMPAAERKGPILIWRRLWFFLRILLQGEISPVAFCFSAAMTGWKEASGSQNWKKRPCPARGRWNIRNWVSES